MCDNNLRSTVKEMYKVPAVRGTWPGHRNQENFPINDGWAEMWKSWSYQGGKSDLSQENSIYKGSVIVENQGI